MEGGGVQRSEAEEGGGGRGRRWRRDRNQPEANHGKAAVFVAEFYALLLFHLCISHKLGCRYFIGDFKDEQFLPEQHGLMSWAGAECFAPESLLTPDGRRVMWAWCAPRGARRPLGKKLQTGIQSLPRELSLSADNKLLIQPLRELKKLRTDEKSRAL